MRVIIGGTSLLESPLFSGWVDTVRETPYGEVRVKTDGNHVFLQRHGTPPLPPHRINHHSHIWALKALGATEIVAINSVGSLKTGLKPGSFAIPHDFMSLWDVPTFNEDKMRFLVPEMDRKLGKRLFNACAGLGMDVAQGCVYIQTKGPRLETKAEIAFLQGFGDLVGMTMASEATLCIEAGIPYVSVCSIDNYCNGIATASLTMEEIGRNGRNSLKALEALIQRLCETD